MSFTEELRTIKKVEQYLTRFVPIRSAAESYTLERMLDLMAGLGNPQNTLNVIHVAGTSGKTSTCYFAAALLQTGGKKVGLTVSPHIDSVNERLQINLEPLAEAAYCQYFNEFMMQPIIDQVKPTYFELLVAFAYWVFAKESVDYAVVEVGLGGLIDGTNVVDNLQKVCVITDIGFDHMHILGNTLEAIAEQKAGIIGPGQQALTMQQDPVVIRTIQERAGQQKAQLTVLDPGSVDGLAELAPFAVRNWQLAKAAYDYIASRDGLPDLTQAQQVATAHTVVPARMEVVQMGEKTIIMDGSHNEQKLQALGRAMKQRFGDEPVALLTSFVQTRLDRVDDAVAAITPVVQSVIVTSYQTSQDHNHQSMAAKRVEEAFAKAGCKQVTIVEDPADAFRQLLQQPEKILLITGSFYLLSRIRPLVRADSQ